MTEQQHLTWADADTLVDPPSWLDRDGARGPDHDTVPCPPPDFDDDQIPW